MSSSKWATNYPTNHLTDDPEAQARYLESGVQGYRNLAAATAETTGATSGQARGLMVGAQ